jgi:hypothetical protein
MKANEFLTEVTTVKKDASGNIRNVQFKTPSVTAKQTFRPDSTPGYQQATYNDPKKGTNLSVKGSPETGFTTSATQKVGDITLGAKQNASGQNTFTAQLGNKRIKKTFENTQKGREYNHLEDLVTFEGSKGALKAAEILTRLGQDSKDVSIKWDGNPTLFWGREPDGTFVMTGKNGWGKNKTTSSGALSDFIMNTGKGEDWRQDFANSMGNIFEILEANTPADMKGYVYGDLLYYPSKSFAKTDAGIQFTPNNVTYTVDPNSKLGQRIAGSQVGIVAHTYHDAFGDKQGTPIKNTNSVNSNAVVVLGQTYVTHQPKVDTSDVQDIVSTANANAQIIDNWLAPEQGLSRKDAILYNYVNQMTKQGKLAQLRTGFMDWLKTSKVSKGQQAKLMAGDTKGLDAILELVVKIQTIKNNIIDQLDNAGADVTASTGGERGGEGYVATRDKIKLVPRHRWTPN